MPFSVAVPAMMLRAVSFATFERDIEGIGGGHHHLGVVAHFPRLYRWPVVIAEHDVHLRIVQRALGDHRLRAGERFLRRLEDQLHATAQLAFHLRERGRHAERDHRVHVVTAGVHLPRHLGGERHTALLEDRQRVHVGADADRGAGLRAVDHGDDARLADAAAVLDAEFVEKAAHRFRGLVLLEGKLGMLMQLAAQCHELARALAYRCSDALLDIHDGHSIEAYSVPAATGRTS